MDSKESIIVGGVEHSISGLTEFGFTAVPKIQLVDGETNSRGTLQIGEDRLEVEFRIRKAVDDQSTCSFYGLSLDTTGQISSYLKNRHRHRHGGGLEERTYDELASGLTETGGATAASTTVGNAGSVVGAGDAEPRRHIKTFALMLMMLVGLGLIVVALVFMRSKSTLSVENSALVGNCLRVNSRVEGEIVEVLFREGDEVRKGDVLIRLSNPELESEIELLSVQCETAKAKVVALKKQKDAFSDKLKFAAKKLDLERKVAMSEMKAAQKAAKSAKLAAERLRPYVSSGSVTQLELDEVESMLLAEESGLIAKENLVRQIDFAIDAAGNNILILGDRVDDALGRIEAELAVAEAEAVELEQTCAIAEAREKELEIVAPRDGTIYVNYRQKGEFIKIADELVGISYPGETWAAGLVNTWQASRVLPGQPVKITVPSLKQSLDGVVMAVGHRAMYSKGHYSAEFRGATATDVPVKVYIEDLPEDIPSGIRLQMAIKTGYGIKWLDDVMGYKHHSMGSKTNDVARQSTEVLAAVGINDELN